MPMQEDKSRKVMGLNPALVKEKVFFSKNMC